MAETEILESPVVESVPIHADNCCALCAARIEGAVRLLAEWTPTMIAFGELIKALSDNPMVARMAGIEVPTRRERKRAERNGDDA